MYGKEICGHQVKSSEVKRLTIDNEKAEFQKFKRWKTFFDDVK